AQARSGEIPNAVAGAAVILTVTAPPPPQLQLNKTADVTTALPGQPINYTITAQNTGAGPATNVQITDTLPAGTSFQGADPGGTLLDATTVGWTILTRAPQATATVHRQVLVAGGAPGGALSNVAQVRSAEVAAPVASNGGPPVVVPAVSPPQLQLT